MSALLGTLVVALLVGPLLLVVVVGALLFLAAALMPGASRGVRETFRWPWTGRVVAVDYIVPEWGGHPTEVVACTAFRDPKRVGCPKPCREVAEVLWGPSRGVFPRWALTSGGVVTWRSAEEPAPAR